MKNIHLLPTDKPSRLSQNKEGLHIFEKGISYKAVNIYITKDEEIKEGEWVYNTKYNNVRKYFLRVNGITSLQQEDKKIILTTDQDLIKDGVQAIPDEFLEWFVKNPSCEEVEVNKLCYGALSGFADAGYKIIIPKEIDVLELGQIIPKEKPKQETLEEAKKYAELSYYGDEVDAFVRGVKWQAERMYSEEEVYNIVQKAIEENSSKQLHFFDGGYLNPIYTNLKKWFEQIKKK